MALRLLVVEGNVREAREVYKADWGMTPSQSYAATLAHIAPDAACDICFPADVGAALPDAAGLEGYDGVVLTGSALNIYDASPATRAQLDFARAVYRARVPFFGSCWGLQVAAAAAGGEVVRNPKGREAGVARAIVATQAGRAHPMLAGRGESWDAPCHHLDVVARLPDEATLLASNTYAQVQAAEIRFEGGVFWGVQYHPEFSFGEIASVLRRCAPAMRDEGFYRDADEAERHCDALETLDREPARTDLAWRLGVQPELVDAQLRVSEIRNFIESYVRPEKSRRGRA